ncbi:Uncharacterized protein conserved in bacteria (DUF2252) [Seminavis robusta]|uniref:Uncharacterized protein conserved in bacteria (DUF2252) n=1 Tax=Seminavis robusta TaxID=568900 RepID=A0A9N8D995_9STRA|nr:Uncharacterized protein conserved in bacteria (DUF2252) [Seminavis robusta]|eukprot:Sro21_g014960.1 Uncharacterized protein conserved in bacteria (DUF2252) (469) ;mRNA; f:150959-152365
MALFRRHAEAMALLTFKASIFALVVLGATAARDVVQEVTNWNTNISSADRDSKYCRMKKSPFIFYRGTNHLFWKDFAHDARLDTYGSEETVTWIQGDLHVENFGSFENDQGQVIYSINDYDESIVADYQYDVWRMAISLVLWLNERNVTDQTTQDAVIDAFTESYLDTMASYRGNSDETNKIFTKSNTYGKLDNFLNAVEKDESRQKMLAKWCLMSNGSRYFDLTYYKLENASEVKKADIQAALDAYVASTSYSNKGTGTGEYFDIKDIAKRVAAGTGSRGRERYYILVEGPSEDQDDDIILDVKLQSHPTPYVYLVNDNTRADYDAHFHGNHAERHAVAYKALIDEADNHLGWMHLPNTSGGYFSVRERSPFKKTYDPDGDDSGVTNTGDYEELAAQWGAVLATAHARADQDTNEYVTKSVDKQIDILTDGHHSEFRAQVRHIAYDYANQVVADYNTFVANLARSSC